jgi:hypothetical protein
VRGAEADDSGADPARANSAILSLPNSRIQAGDDQSGDDQLIRRQSTSSQTHDEVPSFAAGTQPLENFLSAGSYSSFDCLVSTATSAHQVETNRGAGPSSDKLCHICSDRSDNLRECSRCKSLVCIVCGSISNNLLTTALPFLAKAPHPTWPTLDCLACGSVEGYDRTLKECLKEVSGAALASLSKKGDLPSQTLLFYNIGLTLIEAGSAGMRLPESFVKTARKILDHEVARKNRSSKASIPSVSPWDGMTYGLPPKLVLDLSCTYARRHKISPMGSLNELSGHDDSFRIVVISADQGDHSTAHLMTAELVEMSKMINLADVRVLCVAKQERVSSMNPDSRYRKALQQAFGDIFLGLGHLPDTILASELAKVKPHAVLLAGGFHQSGDRPKILTGASGAVVIQTIAHARPNGSPHVNSYLAAKPAAAKPPFQKRTRTI